MEDYLLFSIIAIVMANFLMNMKIYAPLLIILFSSSLAFAEVSSIIGDKTSQKKQLTLLSPPSLADFTAGVYQSETLANKTLKELSGYGVNFELKSAPKGMDLYGATAGLSWAPPKAAEGKVFNISIIVNNLPKHTKFDFTVKVATTKLLDFKVNNTLVDIKGSNCKAPSGKEVDFSLLFLKKHPYSSGLVINTVSDLDQSILESLKPKKIVSKVNYDIPSDIEVMSCLFVLGKIEIGTPDNPYKWVYKNNFFMFLSDKMTDRRKLALYRLSTPSPPPTDTFSYQSPSKSIWVPASPELANGLYFIGYKKIKGNRTL